MNTVLKITCCFIAIAITSACSSDGRPQFISDVGVSREVRAAGTDPDTGAPRNRGIQRRRAQEAGIDPDTGDGLLLQFKLTAVEAQPFTFETGAKLRANDPIKQQAFMRAGFALIQARCNTYIPSKADNQRQVNVWRDTFAPVTALLTGALALLSKGEGANNDALTMLSLGTSAASAGFRIYEQRFLFGAENVNSVRLLILGALSDNANVAAKTSNADLNYSQSVTHLINNQAVCSPGHILQLVSEAIKTGKVVSKSDDIGSTSSTEIKAVQDLKKANAVIEKLRQDNGLTNQDIATVTASIVVAPPSPVATPPSFPILRSVTTTVVDK